MEQKVKKLSSGELKEIYKNLEDPNIIVPTPNYVQTIYLYIEGSIKNEYRIIKN